MQTFLAKLKAAGYSLPKRSMLTLADELIQLRGDLPGAFGMTLTNSRRHYKLIKASADLLRDVKALLRRGPLTNFPRKCAKPASKVSLLSIPVHTSICSEYTGIYQYFVIMVRFTLKRPPVPTGRPRGIPSVCTPAGQRRGNWWTSRKLYLPSHWSPVNDLHVYPQSQC